MLYFQCCQCRHQCSLIVGTIFQATKVELPKWFLATQLIIGDEAVLRLHQLPEKLEMVDGKTL